MNSLSTVLGLVGGTGDLGSALAKRWARAGYSVLIGSRDAAKARIVAQSLSRDIGRALESGSNATVAARADLVVVTVPFAAQAETLAAIRDAVAGKIVVDTTVPLVPPRVARVQLPPEGCAALRAQALLGESVRVVSAFHNVAAHKLAADAPLDCDVLVFGDDKGACGEVIRLAETAGLRGLHGGALANSAAAEALTSVLIFINRHYTASGAGVRITGTLTEATDA